MAGEKITMACRRTFESGVSIHAGFEIAGAAGRTTAIFGPSGCGKSTCLRLLAGLDRPDAGSIRCGGTVWSDHDRGVHLSPQARQIGFLTQDPALFPHLSVGENVAYGLQDVPTPERDRRVGEIIEMVGLAHRVRSRPRQLSGGEGQRVALARALVRRPRWLLLDEPFSALDETLRAGVRTDLRALLRNWAVPTVLVTHDRGELEQMADELIVMDHGKVLQTGPVAEVMAHPISLEAARVLGFENLHPLAALGPGPWTRAAGDASHLAFRAEEAVLTPRGSRADDGWFSFPGILQSVQGEGALVRFVVDAGVSIDVLVSRQHLHHAAGAPGQEVEVRLPAARCQFLP